MSGRFVFISLTIGCGCVKLNRFSTPPPVAGRYGGRAEAVRQDGEKTGPPICLNNLASGMNGSAGHKKGFPA